MDLSPTQPTTGSSATRPPASSERSAAVLSSDFETFLKMLTAQARYQDPLEPIDSTEYAAQLAQFSMVEQQVQTNDALASLSTSLGRGGFADLAGWVGMEARAVAPVTFTGAPITVAIAPDPLADAAFLVVSDASGKEVARSDIPLSGSSVEWRGTGPDGALLTPATYTLSVESRRDGAVIDTRPAEVYSRITEAQTRDGAVTLVLQGGQSIPSETVTGLREPTA